MYICTRAKLLCTLCHEIPCSFFLLCFFFNFRALRVKIWVNQGVWQVSRSCLTSMMNLNHLKLLYFRTNIIYGRKLLAGCHEKDSDKFCQTHNFMFPKNEISYQNSTTVSCFIYWETIYFDFHHYYRVFNGSLSATATCIKYFPTRGRDCSTRHPATPSIILKDIWISRQKFVQL